MTFADQRASLHLDLRRCGHVNRAQQVGPDVVFGFEGQGKKSSFPLCLNA